MATHLLCQTTGSRAPTAVPGQTARCGVRATPERIVETDPTCEHCRMYAGRDEIKAKQPTPDPQWSAILALPELRAMRREIQEAYGEAAYKAKVAAAGMRAATRSSGRRAEKLMSRSDETAEYADGLSSRYEELLRAYHRRVNEICADRGARPYVISHELHLTQTDRGQDATIMLRLPSLLVAQLDGATDNRSAFIREAIREKLEHGT